MRRALAVLAAAGMIVAALVIRSRIDDNKPHVVSVSSSGPRTGPLTIVCITELENECNAIHAAHPDAQTRVEDAATTAQTLAKGGTTEIDGWLTLEPWPDIANQMAANQVNGPIFTSETSMASSPLVITTVKQRANVLASNCASGAVDWKCLGNNVGKPWTDLTGGIQAWGKVTVGNPPLTSATGLLLFGNAATGYFGRTDISTNDFDDAFNTWSANMKSTFTDPDAFREFVTQFPAKYSAVGGTAGEAMGNLGTKADQVSVTTPNPAATAVVTLAPVGSGDRAQAVGRLAGTSGLQDTLKMDGWDFGNIPPTTGLPDAGVLLALSGLSR
jgi:hypothetical protein